MKKTFIHVAIASVVALLCVFTALYTRAADEMRIARNLEIFNALYKELNRFYVDSINPDTTIEAAIEVMLYGIDPYTEYIPGKSHDDFMVVSTGEYGGIGSYIMQRDNGVCISEPYAGSPAQRAGLRAGDRIIKIDTASTVGWSQDKVSEHLKGQANTPISVTVVRPYTEDSVLTFNFMREKIKIDPVPFSGVLKENLGYINLSTFNEHSAAQVKEALLRFKGDPRVKAIVLDLRGNGGGLLESAVQIVGYFVPKGTQVLQTRGKTTRELRTYKTTEEPIDTKMPLAVIIDGSSASASEITAGALQDLDRAVIVGSRSFGKGLVQTTRPLPYDAMLKVTIAKYYIPSGRLIQEIDYSHRNADGSGKRIPDSLTTVFHTASGREVRDGGGITPDVKIEYPKINRLVYNVVRDHWAFDFATKYASEHPSIKSPGEFEITDTIFNEFKRFIDPARFNYDKVCETGLDALRKVATDEGYMNDTTTVETFDLLATLLKHDLNRDLDNNRNEISRLLASEIVTRYYNKQGEIEQSLVNDEALDRIKLIFAQDGEYERILRPAEKK